MLVWSVSDHMYVSHPEKYVYENDSNVLNKILNSILWGWGTEKPEQTRQEGLGWTKEPRKKSMENAQIILNSKFSWSL